MYLQRISWIWILTLMILSLIFASPGYCDKWVYINEDVMFSYYYDKENINIDRSSNIINVWIKYIHTEKGKKLFHPINNELTLYRFDYNKKQYQILNDICYHNAEIVRTHKADNELAYIKPESLIDEIVNKIANDYNLKSIVKNVTPGIISMTDDWVYVIDGDMFSFYYNPKDIKIDKKLKRIEVWVKEILSERERNKSRSSDKLNYSLVLILFDYYNMTSKELRFINYFMSGKIKEHIEDMKDSQITDIEPGEVYDKILIKILKDNNIER